MGGALLRRARWERRGRVEEVGVARSGRVGRGILCSLEAATVQCLRSWSQLEVV
jgi:hypothetical protein